MIIYGTKHKQDRSFAPYDFGVKGHTYYNTIYMGHTHPFSRYPQDHDLSISNPNAYNFLYYTGSGNPGEREHWFMPFNIVSGKDGSLKYTVKNGYGNIKLPNVIR